MVLCVCWDRERQAAACKMEGWLWTTGSVVRYGLVPAWLHTAGHIQPGVGFNIKTIFLDVGIIGIPTLVRHLNIKLAPREKFQHEDFVSSYRDYHCKIRLSHDCLIFIMGIPILVRYRCYVKKFPRILPASRQPINIIGNQQMVISLIHNLFDGCNEIFVLHNMIHVII